MDIVRVSCVLARADYMAYTYALMMFWILGSLSTNCMFFSLGYRLLILLNLHLLCQIVGWRNHPCICFLGSYLGGCVVWNSCGRGWGSWSWIHALTSCEKPWEICNYESNFNFFKCVMVAFLYCLVVFLFIMLHPHHCLVSQSLVITIFHSLSIDLVTHATHVLC